MLRANFARTRRIFAWAVVWSTVALIVASCDTEIPEGRFPCVASQPGDCPPGWVCQNRGIDGQWRCYSEEGPYCGDGQRGPDEECDQADLGDASCPLVGDLPTAAICSPNCTLRCTECGDGILESTAAEGAASEQCDDGNYRSGDGCSSHCGFELERWTKWHPLVGARMGHDMVYDESRRLLVLFGGRTAEGVVADTWEHDGWVWRRAAPATSPPARQYHAMAYDAARQRVVVFGGVNPQGAYLDDTWEFDGLAWTQASTETTPSYRRDHAMAYDEARGRVVLFGGERLDEYGSTEILGDTWEYDGSDWMLVAASGPVARRGHRMVYDGAGARVLLLAGESSDDDLRDLWGFDGTSWIEVGSPAPSEFEDRRHFGLAVDRSRDVLVVHSGRRHTQRDADTWEYDLAGDSWTELPTAPDGLDGRERFAMAYHRGAGLVVAYGGISASQLSGDTWSYDYDADESPPWRQLTAAPQARENHSIAYDSRRGVVVVWGGTYEENPVDAVTWEFDGTHWIPNDTPHKPSPRLGQAMVYDEHRQVVVLYGGKQTNDSALVSDDLWEYDGSDWTQRVLQTEGPAPRFLHAMAYDSAAAQVIMYGGATSQLVIYDDTWAYDGNGWTERAVDAGPPRRAMHQLAYSPVRRQTVLFGGLQMFERYAETWEYDFDSDRWTEVHTPSAPQARAGFGMAFDAARYRIMLYGGFDGDSLLTDTWDFDGSSWRRRSPLDQPPRAIPAMAFDQWRRRLVAFGGALYAGTSDETWEYSFGSGSLEACGDSDGDGDNLTGCADPDCSLAAACERPWTACVDDLGQVDCTKTLCGGYPCDELGRMCVDGQCMCTWGSAESDCANGQDDNCDGLADCQDEAACRDQPRCEHPESSTDDRPCCEYPETSCDDGFDNDGDRLIDCADRDDCVPNRTACEGAEEATCDDGFDNDGDGETDCEDGDCAGKPICPLIPQF